MENDNYEWKVAGKVLGGVKIRQILNNVVLKGTPEQINELERIVNITHGDRVYLDTIILSNTELIYDTDETGRVTKVSIKRLANDKPML